jgi:hypothetical protein
MRRPHIPETFLGLRVRPWSLTMRMATGSKSLRKVEQQSSRPQLPMPPMMPAPLRALIWFISTRRPRRSRARVRLRTRLRKSMRPSALKKQTIKERSRARSAVMNFMSRLRSRAMVMASLTAR